MPSSISARHFATASDQINFGAVNLTNPTIGNKLLAFSVHFRAAFDAAAINTDAKTVYHLISQWTSGNYLFRIYKRGVQLICFVGYGGWTSTLTIADCGLYPAGIPDTGWHDYLYSWSTPANQGGTLYKDGVAYTNVTSYVPIKPIGYLNGSNANLLIGNAAATGAPPPGVAICDVGFWTAALSAGDAQTLARGVRSQNVCSAALTSAVLLDSSNPTTSTGRVTLAGTVAGTTLVSGPTLQSAYGLVLTLSAQSTPTPTPVTVTVGWGPLGPPATGVTVTWTISSGAITPTSQTLAATSGATINFTFTPGNVYPDTVTLTAHNNGGLGDVTATLAVTAPNLSIKSARVLDSGKLVLLQFQDANGNDADITAFPTLPTLKINGGPALTPHGVLWQNPSGTNGYRLNGNRSNRAYLSLPATPSFAAIVDDTTAVFFTTTGSWSLVQAPSYDTPVGYNNTYHRSSGTTDTAAWQLTGLTAGLSYRVHATWWADTDRTSAATYTIRDGSLGGKVLGSATFDQRKSPAATEPFYGTDGAVWRLVGTVTPTGTILFVVLANTAGSGLLTADAVRIEVVRVMTTVRADDTVTLSAPQGFACSAAGACRPYTDLPVTNLVGGSILPPFQMTQKKMGTGYNLGPVSYWENGWYYRNRVKACTGGWSTGFGTISTDSGGNLTAVSNSASLLVTTVGQNTGTTGLYWGLPYICNGTWTLSYKGPSGSLPLGSLTIVAAPNSTCTKLSETIVNGRNVATYRVIAGPNQSGASVKLVATAVPAHDIILYEPDVDFYDPVTNRSDVSVGPDPLDANNIWNKWTLDRLAGSQIIRAVGPLHVDVCSTREWADFNHGTEDYLTPNHSRRVSASDRVDSPRGSDGRRCGWGSEALRPASGGGFDIFQPPSFP